MRIELRLSGDLLAPIVCQVCTTRLRLFRWNCKKKKTVQGAGLVSDKSVRSGAKIAALLPRECLLRHETWRRPKTKHNTVQMPRKGQKLWKYAEFDKIINNSGIQYHLGHGTYFSWKLWEVFMINIKKNCVNANFSIKNPQKQAQLKLGLVFTSVMAHVAKAFTSSYSLSPV